MSEMTVTGNLAADAELKVTPSGSPYLKFRLIENKSRKREDGTFETIKSQGFNVTVWGSLGEMHFESGLMKGDRIRAVGEFWSRDYDKQDGTQGVAMDFTAWGIHPFEKARNKPTPQQNAPQQSGGGSNANTYEPGGWGTQPQQQPQQPPQGQQGGGRNQQQQQQQQQGGGWNAPPQQQQNPPPANDPWTQTANTNGGWGNQ